VPSSTPLFGTYHYHYYCYLQCHPRCYYCCLFFINIFASHYDVMCVAVWLSSQQALSPSQPLPPNMRVISNFFRLAPDGTVRGFSSPVVHERWVGWLGWVQCSVVQPSPPSANLKTYYFHKNSYCNSNSKRCFSCNMCLCLVGWCAMWWCAGIRMPPLPLCTWTWHCRRGPTHW
jgi:hypothetical protein